MGDGEAGDGIVGGELLDRALGGGADGEGIELDDVAGGDGLGALGQASGVGPLSGRARPGSGRRSSPRPRTRRGTGAGQAWPCPTWGRRRRSTAAASASDNCRDHLGDLPRRTKRRL
jgi:hypothetical protein